ncbi:phage tail protein [Salmonella enterica subsp. enterica]|uniref:Phage tail protein n=7 Tax=Salmonella enterica TaxID=28901 RepID=A0A5I8PNK5_SALPT|nr:MULTISPECIES: tail fiber protein [Salmonella]EBR0326413.1 phage tail protein [Salmonella enterica subsp. enterica serovar Newport]ECD7318556.1 phage tail protein [Salmonella enterica subsp. enterica serovar Typhi]ECG1374216.1 phage tail protein [Salmonella enterica subsp. enterica serovar Stanley str. CFSAN000623]EDT2623718.1 phage tail protein [Salmonella enterica subsp. enterica serovar Java]HAB6959683.1 phage tail protein [Salmonella enterica subsp. enterica serovar Typhi str. 404ty]
MSTKFKTVITTAGAAKLAAATMPGGKKINLNVMAVGDGGGKLPEPDAGQTQLVNEVWRHTLNKISQDNRYSNYIVAELVIPPEVGGFWMRELGLYDDEGTLIAVANMAESYKPELAEGSGRAQTCRMVIIVSSVESVALSIDSTMVMATQDYVDDRLAEHEKSRRHPDATLKEKGFTQLSNATDSESETLAATPKAVKAAYDLADAKYTAQDATTTRKGIVQLSNATDSVSETLAATPKAVKVAYDLANAKYTAQEATTARKGIIQLSNATDSTSETLAATPKAVKTAMDNANGRLAKNSNGGDIPDKKQFARTIGAVTSTNITFNDASGWYKIATVVMPQATSTAVIKLYGGAGFNVGLFEQAAISELVLRAGNGSPVGITATLWRRSPTSANEVAWVNTSGDTYDIYINIGQHAYWLIAQYDYTGNANVTLYSTPEYSSVQPGNSTSGQTYTLFNSLMKPTYEDVGALPITGGQLNGPLGIGTDNALGGNSIVLGDNDTGFKQDGDGILGIYANNARVGYIDNSGLHLSVDVLTNGGIRAGDGKRLSLTSNNNSTMTATFNLWGDANRPTVIELDDDQGWHLYSQRNPDGSIVFTVNGDITANTLRAGGAIYQNNGDIFGSVWGNSWLSLWINNNFVADVQLGAGTSVTTWNNAGSWPNTPGYVVTSVWKDNQGENIDGINYAPLQKRVGNQWYTVQGGTV